MHRTNKRFQIINSESISDFPIFRPKIIMFSKKKGLHSESISDFPIFRPKIIMFSKKKKKKVFTQNRSDFPIFHPKIRWLSDIARYNLWNIFAKCNAPPLSLQCTAGWPPLMYMYRLKERSQDQSMLNAVFQVVNPALLAVTGNKGKLWSF